MQFKKSSLWNTLFVAGAKDDQFVQRNRLSVTGIEGIDMDDNLQTIYVYFL